MKRAEAFADEEARVTEAMLRGTMEWPNILLPLKNRQERDPQLPSMPLTGFVSNPGEPVCIVVGNIFMGPSEPVERREYPTVGEAMAAGWVVD